MGNFPNADPSVLPHDDRILSTFAQIKRLQRLCYDKAFEDGVKNHEIAKLALAWERLEERKRVMRGKPLPKAADLPTKKLKILRPHAELAPEPPVAGAQEPSKPSGS